MSNSILIVDDMRINIDALTGILRPLYTVMAAISGENAIKLLQRRKPDLVLLDLSMPGIDGFGVLEYMRNDPELKPIPVIFVTGEHDSLAEERGLELGAVDYIKKPYNAAVVSAKVRNHLELKAYRDNLELLVFERTKELEARTMQLAASQEAIIMGMSLMSEIHDLVTGSHIRRIKSYSRVLTDLILEHHPDMLTPELANAIVLYSPLHDVGKVSIPDSILKKPGSLTSEEFDVIKSHTSRGAELLRDTETFLVDDGTVSSLDVAIEIAEGHHEKFDGTGYPHGLAGSDIPISARIVAVTDVYDALRSPRTYKAGFTHSEATEIILVGDGRTDPEHFDPVVLDMFRRSLDLFNRVYEEQE